MSVHFPDEIIDKILVRLDPKSLIKFSAVCKSWRSLIKSPTFIHTHLSRTIQPNNQNDSHLLLLVSTKADTGMIYSFRWDNPEFSEYTRLIDRFADNEERSAWYLNVVGTCNGLVCLSLGYNKLRIWNPSVRRFVILPSPISEYIARYAFGYDSRNNDYKVLRTVNLPGQTECYQAEIWSLARGSWKSLGVGSTGRGFLSELIQQPALVNDAVHWVQLNTTKGENGIMWFDMVSESFGETRVPQCVTKMLMLTFRHEENLALLTWDSASEYHPCSYDIWVMKEYGVQESWTKLFSARHKEFIIRPLCWRNSGEIVFKMFGGGLLSLDVQTEQIKYLTRDGNDCYFLDYYVESLVLLGEANAISY
ncbi:hypothetical protein CerSpe_157960 [Prunus speciosa]